MTHSSNLNALSMSDLETQYRAQLAGLASGALDSRDQEYAATIIAEYVGRLRNTLKANAGSIRAYNNLITQGEENGS